MISNSSGYNKSNCVARVVQRLRMFFIHCLDIMLHTNSYYAWHILSRRLTKEWEKQIAQHYTSAPNPKKPSSNSDSKQVIFICNGTILSGGWADRLRGIISTFMLCKENGWQFKLLFNHPFPLELFFIPNTYDWRIDEKDVVYDRAYATYVPLEITSESDFQARKQKEWLQSRIASAATPQVHVYTNAMFSYNGDFSSAFHELFRPSERLQQAVDKQLAALGQGYVSVSARFLNAFGDFTDTADMHPLDEPLRSQLLGNCMQCLERLHKLNPGKPLLVNSDSRTFLAEAARLPYTHIVQGTITHIDTECAESGSLYERYEKTLLDYLLIANAERMYRIDGKWLHTSGYPLSASKVYGRPFVAVEYQCQD